MTTIYLSYDQAEATHLAMQEMKEDGMEFDSVTLYFNPRSEASWMELTETNPKVLFQLGMKTGKYLFTNKN